MERDWIDANRLQLNSARSETRCRLEGAAVQFRDEHACRIEAAADALTPEQKQELLLFLATRLRAQSAKLPEPRKFGREQIAGWIAQDKADMQRFREDK